MSKHVGSVTKYYLSKAVNENEFLCQIDPYNGSTYWVEQKDRATAFDELEHVNNLKNIQEMMAKWFGHAETFEVLKETKDVSVVTS